MNVAANITNGLSENMTKGIRVNHRESKQDNQRAGKVISGRSIGVSKMIWIRKIKKVNWHSSIARQKGQSLVEFMIVIPIFLVLVVGIIELGYFLATLSAVSSGAQEGARYASVSGGSSGETPYLDCTGTRSAVSDGAGALIDLEESDIHITYDSGQQAAPIGDCGAVGASEIDSGDRLVVTVTTNYIPVTGLLEPLVEPFPLTFTATRTLFIGGVNVAPAP